MDIICESSCVDMDFSFIGILLFNLFYEVCFGLDILFFSFFSIIVDIIVVFCFFDFLVELQDFIWQFGVIFDVVCVDMLMLQDIIVVQFMVRDIFFEILCFGEILIVNGIFYDVGNLMGVDIFLVVVILGCDFIVVVMIDFFLVDINFVV